MPYMGWTEKLVHSPLLFFFSEHDQDLSDIRFGADISVFRCQFRRRLRAGAVGAGAAAGPSRAPSPGGDARQETSTGGG